MSNKGQLCNVAAPFETHMNLPWTVSHSLQRNQTLCGAQVVDEVGSVGGATREPRNTRCGGAGAFTNHFKRPLNPNRVSGINLLHCNPVVTCLVIALAGDDGCAAAILAHLPEVVFTIVAEKLTQPADVASMRLVSKMFHRAATAGATVAKLSRFATGLYPFVCKQQMLAPV